PKTLRDDGALSEVSAQMRTRAVECAQPAVEASIEDQIALANPHAANVAGLERRRARDRIPPGAHHRRLGKALEHPFEGGERDAHECCSNPRTESSPRIDRRRNLARKRVYDTSSTARGRRGAMSRRSAGRL